MLVIKTLTEMKDFFYEGCFDGFISRLKSTEKEIELKSYNKVARYNINIQKEIIFLYASNEQVEFEMKNNTFILTPQRIKHLGINLTKYIPDQYEEDYKTMTKEIKEANINSQKFHVYG